MKKRREYSRRRSISCAELQQLFDVVPTCGLQRPLRPFLDDLPCVPVLLALKNFLHVLAAAVIVLEVVHAANCLLHLRLRNHFQKGRVIVPVCGVIEIVCNVEFVAVRRFQPPNLVYLLRFEISCHVPYLQKFCCGRCPLFLLQDFSPFC